MKTSQPETWGAVYRFILKVAKETADKPDVSEARGKSAADPTAKKQQDHSGVYHGNRE